LRNEHIDHKDRFDDAKDVPKDMRTGHEAAVGTETAVAQAIYTAQQAANNIPPFAIGNLIAAGHAAQMCVASATSAREEAETRRDAAEWIDYIESDTSASEDD